MDRIRRWRRLPIVASIAFVLAACGSSGSEAALSPTPIVRTSAPSSAPTTAPTSPAQPSRPPTPPGSSDETPPPPTRWGHAIDRLIGSRQVSVAVRVGSTLAYTHLAAARSVPASNEKLLLSMTALSELGPDYRIPTDAAVETGTLHRGVVQGNLWIVGHGDPEFDDAAAQALAAKIRAAGIRRITGSILGDTTGFTRDRHAPGWHPLALENIGLPTALSFDHNVGPSGFVMVPELLAARAMTSDLRTMHVRVAGTARAAVPGASLRPVATVRSAPLAGILHRQNLDSINQDAETISKLLGKKFGAEPSIAGGAAVIQAWLRDHGVSAKTFDASGLSYRDRISTMDLSGLLASALSKPWGEVLRTSLPAPGQGTLRDRLHGIHVRAKTGTLTEGISALSGYVTVRSGGTASFSILSHNISKDVAIRIEDAIVRILASRV